MQKHEIKDQWEQDKQEFKTLMSDWANDWKKLGWNALIPIGLLVGFFCFIGSIIFHVPK